MWPSSGSGPFGGGGTFNSFGQSSGGPFQSGGDSNMSTGNNRGSRGNRGGQANRGRGRGGAATSSDPFTPSSATSPGPFRQQNTGGGGRPSGSGRRSDQQRTQQPWKHDMFGGAGASSSAGPFGNNSPAGPFGGAGSGSGAGPFASPSNNRNNTNARRGNRGGRGGGQGGRGGNQMSTDPFSANHSLNTEPFGNTSGSNPFAFNPAPAASNPFGSQPSARGSRGGNRGNTRGGRGGRGGSTDLGAAVNDPFAAAPANPFTSRSPPPADPFSPSTSPPPTMADPFGTSPTARGGRGGAANQRANRGAGQSGRQQQRMSLGRSGPAQDNNPFSSTSNTFTVAAPDPARTTSNATFLTPFAPNTGPPAFGAPSTVAAADAPQFGARPERGGRNSRGTGRGGGRGGAFESGTGRGGGRGGAFESATLPPQNVSSARGARGTFGPASRGSTRGGRGGFGGVPASEPSRSPPPAQPRDLSALIRLAPAAAASSAPTRGRGRGRGGAFTAEAARSPPAAAGNTIPNTLWVKFGTDQALNEPKFLREHFSQFGSISKLQITRNYALITFASAPEARAALNSGWRTEDPSKRLTIAWARTSAAPDADAEGEEAEGDAGDEDYAGEEEEGAPEEEYDEGSAAEDEVPEGVAVSGPRDRRQPVRYESHGEGRVIRTLEEEDADNNEPTGVRFQIRVPSAPRGASARSEEPENEEAAQIERLSGAPTRRGGIKITGLDHAPDAPDEEDEVEGDEPERAEGDEEAPAEGEEEEAGDEGQEQADGDYVEGEEEDVPEAEEEEAPEDNAAPASAENEGEGEPAAENEADNDVEGREAETAAAEEEQESVTAAPAIRVTRTLEGRTLASARGSRSGARLSAGERLKLKLAQRKQQQAARQEEPPASTEPAESEEAVDSSADGPRIEELPAEPAGAAPLPNAPRPVVTLPPPSPHPARPLAAAPMSRAEHLDKFAASRLAFESTEISRLRRLIDESDANLQRVAASVGDEALVGQCMTMCSERERIDREEKKELSVFECRTATYPLRADPDLAVKKYHRSSPEDKTPLWATAAEVRPPRVLWTTLEYLTNLLLSKRDEDFPQLYPFIRDRMRGIQQDIILQRACDGLVLELVERTCRFYIYAEHRLCADDVPERDSAAAPTSRPRFDSKLNVEQLNKGLITLSQLYQDMAQEGQYSPNEAEFWSYLMLISIDNPLDVHSMLAGLRPEIRNSREIRFAQDVQLTLQTNNYRRFFMLIHSAPYLTACVMHLKFNDVRTRALRVMNQIYPRREELPLSYLMDVLAFDSLQEAQEFCEHFGLEVAVGGGDEPVLVLKDRSFIVPATKPHRHSSAIIEKKVALVVTIKQLVDLPPRLYTFTAAMAPAPVPVATDVNRPPPPAQKPPAPKEAPPKAVPPPTPTPKPKAALAKQPKPTGAAVLSGVASLTELFGPPPTPRTLPSAAFDPKQTRYEFHVGDRNTNVALETSSSPATPLPPRRPLLTMALVPLTPIRQFQAAPVPTPAMTPAPERRAPSPLTPMAITPVPPLKPAPAAPSADVLKAARRAKAEAMARRRMLALLHGAFQHWRTVANVLAEEREWQLQMLKEQIQRETHFRERVGSQLLRPREFTSPSRISRPASAGPVTALPSGPELSASEALDQLQQERDRARLTMLEPIDLPRVLHPLLKRNSPHVPNLFWKLVVLAEESDNFGSDWLLAKLSRGNRVQGLERSPGSQTLSLYQSFDLDNAAADAILPATEKKVSTNSLGICVTRLYSAPDQDLHRELAGTQALFVVLEPLTPSPQYWRRQRRRLVEAKQAAGSAAAAPLVIAHFHRSLAAAAVEQELETQGAHVLLIEDDSFEQNAAAKESSLTRAIRWAAARTAPQPIVAAADLRTLVEGRLESAAEQCYEFCSRLAPQVASPLPAFIAVYNTELNRLRNQLADSDWQRLSWPAPEFAAMALPDHQLPPLGWNSAEAHQEVIALLENLALPTFDSRVMPAQQWFEPLVQYAQQVQGTAARLDTSPLAVQIHALLRAAQSKQERFAWPLVLSALLTFKLAPLIDLEARVYFVPPTSDPEPYQLPYAITPAPSREPASRRSQDQEPESQQASDDENDQKEQKKRRVDLLNGHDVDVLEYAEEKEPILEADAAVLPPTMKSALDLQPTAMDSTASTAIISSPAPRGPREVVLWNAMSTERTQSDEFTRSLERLVTDDPFADLEF